MPGTRFNLKHIFVDHLLNGKPPLEGYVSVGEAGIQVGEFSSQQWLWAQTVHETRFTSARTPADEWSLEGWGRGTRVCGCSLQT